jgi:hypothetical protein
MSRCYERIRGLFGKTEMASNRNKVNKSVEFGEKGEEFARFMRENPGKDFFDFAIENDVEVQVWTSNSFPVNGRIISVDDKSVAIDMGKDGVNVISLSTLGNIRWPFKQAKDK